MICKERCIVLDIDGTICPIKREEESYEELQPYPEMLAQLQAYRKQGFYIILYTARSMNSLDGNVGKIIAQTGKKLMHWLEENHVPYDEIHFGKPWPGKGGFYVDDKSIRPAEFLQLSYEEIVRLTGG